MPFFVCYDPNTLEIKRNYEYTNILDRGEGFVHVEVVPPLHYECVKLQTDELGNVGLIRDDDKWNDKFNHEINFIRNKRNELLSKSDISQLDDIKTSMTEEKKQEWINYRKLLRDFPSLITDPFNPVWPTPPE